MKWKKHFEIHDKINKLSPIEIMREDFIVLVEPNYKETLEVNKLSPIEIIREDFIVLFILNNK